MWYMPYGLDLNKFILGYQQNNWVTSTEEECEKMKQNPPLKKEIKTNIKIPVFCFVLLMHDHILFLTVSH